MMLPLFTECSVRSMPFFFLGRGVWGRLGVSGASGLVKACLHVVGQRHVCQRRYVSVYWLCTYTRRLE